MFAPEEKVECADIILEIGSDYMKYDGMKLYRECGQQEKYVDCLEGHHGAEIEPYLELIEYYPENIVIFLIKNVEETGD